MLHGFSTTDETTICLLLPSLSLSPVYSIHTNSHVQSPLRRSTLEFLSRPSRNVYAFLGRYGLTGRHRKSSAFPGLDLPPFDYMWTPAPPSQLDLKPGWCPLAASILDRPAASNDCLMPAHSFLLVLDCSGKRKPISRVLRGQ